MNLRRLRSSQSTTAHGWTSNTPYSSVAVLSLILSCSNFSITAYTPTNRYMREMAKYIRDPELQQAMGISPSHIKDQTEADFLHMPEHTRSTFETPNSVGVLDSFPPPPPPPTRYDSTEEFFNPLEPQFKPAASFEILDGSAPPLKRYFDAPRQHVHSSSSFTVNGDTPFHAQNEEPSWFTDSEPDYQTDEQYEQYEQYYEQTTSTLAESNYDFDGYESQNFDSSPSSYAMLVEHPSPPKQQSSIIKITASLTLPDSNNPFELLGLDPENPPEDTNVIRKAFIERAKIYHPDARTGPQSTSEERRKASLDFAKINNAYRFIRDNMKEFGDDFFAVSFGGPRYEPPFGSRAHVRRPFSKANEGFDDEFGSIFSGVTYSARQGQKMPKRGRDNSQNGYNCHTDFNEYGPDYTTNKQKSAKYKGYEESRAPPRGREVGNNCHAGGQQYPPFFNN